MQSFLLLFKKTLSLTSIRFLLLFSFVFFISGDIGLAATETTGLTKDDADGIVKILNGFIAIFGTLLGLVSAFITLFLFPGWTNGTLFGLTEYLRDIWVLVSNVVYFIFAFILVTIAFMNIIGKGEGNWELKQALPRFIVGVLIVPFTWFLVQFILSISAVLTVAVLSLPYDIFAGRVENDTNDSAILQQDICFDVIILLQGEGAPENSTSIGGEDSPMNESVRCREGGKASVMDIVTGQAGGQGIKNSIFGIMSVYSYGILRVQELTKVDVGDIQFYKELADLILKIVFDFLFIAVYLLLMVALLLALFVRGIKLWIFIMLSPVFGLMYFFGKAKEGWNEKYSPTEFIALAMVPVYVSAALAFGFTFILVATEGLKDTVGEGQSLDQLDLGGFKLEIVGSYGDGELELGVIGKLITQIFGVAILWIAVMAALGASKNTAAIVKPIADFGESVGKLAAAAPTYAPIIPTGGGPGSGMSVAGLGALGSQLETTIRGGAQSRGTDFAQRVMGQGGNNAEAGIRQMFASSGITTSTTDNGQRADLIREVLDRHGRDILTDTRARTRFEEELRDIGIDVQLRSAQTTEQIAANLHEAIKDFQGVRDLNRNGWDTRESLQRYLEGLQSNSQQTPPPATGTPTPPVGPTNINMIINGTGVTNTTQAANAYLADRAQFGGPDSVRTHLNAEAATNNNLTPPVINAIVQAFEEGLSNDGNS